MSQNKKSNGPQQNRALPPGDPVASYKYPSKRKNIPPAGLAAQGTLQEAPKLRYEYNPHLPPALRSATAATETDRLPELLQTSRKRALNDDEARTLADALRKNEPWLEWSGKREKPWFEVEPVALHIHERVSTQAILRVLARQDVQRDLFADPQQSYAEAVQFYKYDMDWANRLILGDSLQVMASLARREDLAGKVQMIYFDPPYGIKFSSNFQPQLGQRDVKDREQDLTREPEMVKAYRDTWTLGIHSYLAYLRDRLAMAKELITDSGSIFVQISDENLHRIRCVMDEVFGIGNFISVISFATTTGFSSNYISNVTDHVLWYAKDASKMRFRQLYKEKTAGEEGAAKYKPLRPDQHELSNAFGDEQLASFDQITAQGATTTNQKFSMQGENFEPPAGMHWKTSVEGLNRLRDSLRLRIEGSLPRYARLMSNFPVFPLTNIWMDIGGVQNRTEGKIYVVQTASTVIERCMLMTTDPGDLVLDPTCGSGTTAFVAEQWGRRWITVDTSRVALALAKQRLLTSRFPYNKLRDLNAEDVSRNPKGTWLKNGGLQPRTFSCKTVPHITLKSIARNTSLDPIFAKHEPILAERIKELNATLKKVTPDQSARLADKLRRKPTAAVGCSPVTRNHPSASLNGKSGKSHSIPTPTGPSFCRKRCRITAPPGGPKWMK
jgi:adenine-specific DNA-methyltransferase